VLLCTLFFHGGFQRLSTLAPLRLLGNVSYSFYLIHGLSILATRELMRLIFGAQATGLGLYWSSVLASAVVSVSATLVLFALVEKPFSLAAYIKSAKLERAFHAENRRSPG